MLLLSFTIPDPESHPHLAEDFAFLRGQVIARNARLIRDLNFAAHIEKSIPLASDIIYYLSVVGHEVDNQHSSYGLYLIPGLKLPEKRQAFIRDAASRNDLQAVIDTTPPC